MPSRPIDVPRSQSAAKPKPAARACALFATIGSLASWFVPSAAAAAELPVPCATGACGANGPTTWVTAGSAGLVQTGNSMTITQSTENATFNWKSFNISGDGSVTFKQPDAAAVALNQIFQSDPSKILGALNANGSVYLINQNGIIFGSGAQVNTGSLLASTLNITPTALTGILNAGLADQPAFTSFVDANGNKVSGAVQVQAGATLTAPGGEVLLFGQNVSNQGTVSANGGQVILAAGDSVYLAASTDPNLRGLLVEVGKGGTVTNAAATTAGGSDYGRIAAADGDVTMVGLIVNQLGRVSATTAVQENGSIHLLAQDGGSATYIPGNVAANLQATNAGTLTLGSASQTDVSLDLSSTATAVDSTAQPRSQIVLSGNDVTLAGGAEITAPSANVTINAQANPTQSPQDYPVSPSTGRLVIDPGASIDVSGASVELPMSSNLLAVQLRGTELANSPLQRNGALYGQTVYVDIRQSGTLADGTAWIGSPIGDLFGYVSTIQRQVGARNLTGGAIHLNSDGAVFVDPGATLNVSGGRINYQSGYLNTTKLLGANGLVYDISQANPNQAYVGIANNYSFSDPKWGITQNYPGLGLADPRGNFVPGYVQGADAGSVAIAAPRLVLDGNIQGGTVVGPLQRILPDANTYPYAGAQYTELYRPIDQIPLGATLVLGDPNGGTTQSNFLLPNVDFANTLVYPGLSGTAGAPFDPLSDPLPASLDTTVLRPALFSPGGIANLQLAANGIVTIPAGTTLALPDAGSLSILAGAIVDAGQLTAPSGSVSLVALPTQSILPDSAQATLTLASGAAIDVNGLWVNDQPTALGNPSTDPLAINGGRVTIKTGGLVPLDLQSGSRIDVSGGAQRTAAGAIHGGSAGSIAITAGGGTSGVSAPANVSSSFDGLSLTKGGRFTLTANALCIATSDCSGAETGLVWVPTTLFSADGFASISLTADVGGLALEPGTQIAAQQLNLALNGNESTAPTGTSFAALTTPTLLPEVNRAAMSLSLNVSPSLPAGLAYTPADFSAAGILAIGDHASLSVDPTGSIALNSNTSVVIDGALSAPAGSISVATGTGLQLNGFPANQGIWLDSSASLSTQGVAQLVANDLGQRTGSVLDGGTISVTANRGYIVTAAGSLLDASGTAANVNLAQSASISGVLTAAPSLIASNGGTINLTAAEGMLLNGTAAARAGAGPGASGGTLAVTLDGNLHADVMGTPLFPLAPPQLIVTSGPVSVVGPQVPVPSQFNGEALVPVSLIDNGGFGGVDLTARNLFDLNFQTNVPVATASIVFSHGIDLQLPASIRLDAPEIVAPPGGTVTLSAPYVSIGNTDSRYGAQVGSAAAPGQASLNVQADLVDIAGTLGLSGFSNAAFTSSGDIRFEGIENDTGSAPVITGALLASGTVSFTAQQLYPTTLSRYSVSVAPGLDGTSALAIAQAGGAPQPVLSAGGALTLAADSINQSGTLRAPFGTITLNAPTIDLAAGSLTSVSGAGQIIPFGATQAGRDWVYQMPSGNLQVLTQSGPPGKLIQLNGNDITIARGATVDLSGGGDLQASEFVSGTTGTVDVLANGYAPYPGQFAIVPSLDLRYAPIDPQSQTGFQYAPGSTIVLAGGGGIAAGTYAILPASYALLPGAYLVRPVTGYTDIAFGQSYGQTDGSTVIAGRFGIANTGYASPRTQGFDIRAGSAVQNLANYALTSANSFFTNAANSAGAVVQQLPVDAGQLQFAAGSALQFLGQLAVGAPRGGRGGPVAQSAPHVGKAPNRGGGGRPGGGALDASQLNAFGAQSLLIGGTRTAGATATNVTTTAASVSVDSGVTLTAPDLLLAATDTLTIASGATLDAQGAAAYTPPAYDFSGGGSVVRVSTGAQAPIVRTGLNAAPGVLSIAAGATLAAGGSASLEASGNLQSQATYQLAGGSLAFSASQIDLGSAPAGTQGLVLSPTALSSLGLQSLSLSSASSIDLFGSTALTVDGGLQLAANSIVAATPDAAASLQAKTLTIAGAPGAGPALSTASAGSLTFAADTVTLAGGGIAINGFASTSIVARSSLRAGGSGSLASDGALTLSSPLIDTGSGVNYQVATTDALVLQGSGSPATGAPCAAPRGGCLDRL